MPTRPRYELDNACVMKGWSDADLAALLKPTVSAETVRRWRSGEQTPYKYHITQMCVLFDVKHPKELNLDAQFNASTQSREEIIAMLRRELFEYIKATSIVAGVNPSVLLSATVDDSNEFLNACRAVLDDCWDRHEHKRNLVDNTITTFMPGLRELAMEKSRHQHEAASLAIEAKIIQIIIVTAKQDYKRRVSLGDDIVLIGETSGDKNLHALAIAWHANTYTNCYFQPETAISILNSALPQIEYTSSLNKSSIYMELFKACALDEKDTDKEATKARKYLELAHMAMPDIPELDPLYPCISIGPSELNMYEGNMYLILAKRFPSEKEYAKKAYESLEKSTNQEALNTGYQCKALMHQAEAARCVNNMKHYFDCLEEGLRIAIQRGYQDLVTKIIFVLQKTPRGWRTEKRYKDLDAIFREIMTPTSIQRQNPILAGQ
jgi:hypothetical protein